MIMHISEKAPFCILSQLILTREMAKIYVACLKIVTYDLARVEAAGTLASLVLLLRHTLSIPVTVSFAVSGPSPRAVPLLGGSTMAEYAITKIRLESISLDIPYTS